MTQTATLLPPRRPELVVRPLGDKGKYVVKDPDTESFFQLGEQECFLLMQLDGRRDAEAICAAFEERFGEPLSSEDVDDFVSLARRRGFLRSASAPAAADDSAAPRSGQSLLYWRTTLFDPDRVCGWLEPKIRFFWTPTFLAVSAGSILLAAIVLWVNRADLVTSFAGAWRWETLVLAWLTAVAVTFLHEFAHGLTCKHYGGEVHEIGFLLMYLMPCFYCNVSDAWLFREKSKRLWVTFSGGYFELFLWALAAFVWRLTTPDCLANHLAFVVLSVCGVQTLFNLNPLLKLDGYYLLSDWLEIPNLRQRAIDAFTGHARWLLWGAARPRRDPHARVLLIFGVASWVYSLLFLVLMLWGTSLLFGQTWGWVGVGVAAWLGWVTTRGAFQGFSAGEVRTMVLTRRWRAAAWAAGLAGLVGGAFIVQMSDRASGPFVVRPASRADLRAPVAGFLRQICYDEGDEVSPGALVATLDVPELVSRLAQKRAELREAHARVRLLEIGPRPEEVAEQRSRVERGRAWCDLAKRDLVSAQQALGEELTRLGGQITQCGVELATARNAFERAKALRGRGAVSQEEFRETERRFLVAQSRLEQAQSEKRRREALGTREAIAGLDAAAELARREKDLADARSALALLTAGSRPEEVEAERARLARLQEELRYLEGVQAKVRVSSPLAGLIVTPRLREKVGQYFREGDLLCTVEHPRHREVEISVGEQEAARVRPGQAVELKARSAPFETLTCTVGRVAPRAAEGDVQSTVAVYCRLEDDAGRLRPGMTGFGRIYGPPRPIGAILLNRTLGYLRTEFWW